MFCITPCIGGAKIIKEDDQPIAWIDIYGDLNFPSLITNSEKDNIISFLDKANITYNKYL